MNKAAVINGAREVGCTKGNRMSPSLQRNFASPEGRYVVLALYASLVFNLSTCCLNFGFAHSSTLVFNLTTKLARVLGIVSTYILKDSNLKDSPSILGVVQDHIWICSLLMHTY